MVDLWVIHAALTNDCTKDNDCEDTLMTTTEWVSRYLLCILICVNNLDVGLHGVCIMRNVYAEMEFNIMFAVSHSL